MNEKIKFAKLSVDTSPHKYKVVLFDKNRNKLRTLHFGASGMSDFTIHKDVERKKRYIKRHTARENFDDIKTAGFWAKNLLWNKETISASKEDISRRYKIVFI